MQVYKKWGGLEFNYYEMVMHGKDFYTIEKIQISVYASTWTLLNLDITSQDNYGIKFYMSD